MKKSRKIIFIFTREQWIGILILLILAIGTLLTLHFFAPPPEPAPSLVTDSTRQQFAAHQAEQDSIYKASWKKKYPRDTIVLHMQDFDPNTADSVTLVHLGFKKWQASNILKYRKAGGHYRKPEDLKRLYGMTDSMYLALAPYIKITTDTIQRDSLAADTIPLDSLPRYVSYKRDTILNLRTADTTQLQMIRGIGSYRAKQIVRYRQQLGGFYSIEQLYEIKALQPLLTDSATADSLLAHFVLDSVVVEPIHVNWKRPESMRHPYLRFEQAKAIYELRRKYIHIDSIQQLQSLDCFTPEELQRLAPYLNFEKRK